METLEKAVCDIDKDCQDNSQFPNCGSCVYLREIKLRNNEKILNKTGKNE